MSWAEPDHNAGLSGVTPQIDYQATNLDDVLTIGGYPSLYIHCLIML